MFLSKVGVIQRSVFGVFAPMSHHEMSQFHTGTAFGVVMTAGADAAQAQADTVPPSSEFPVSFGTPVVEVGVESSSLWNQQFNHWA